MREVVLLTVGLLEQNVSLPSVPITTPGFVGPAQTERKGRLAALAYLVERTLQQPPSVKPIVVIAERRDAMLEGKRGLGRSNLRQPQIVEAEVRRKVRLVMAPESRP